MKKSKQERDKKIGIESLSEIKLTLSNYRNISRADLQVDRLRDGATTIAITTLGLTAISKNLKIVILI
jgi:hypothetical protein